jgi:hypothetical protein
MIASAWAMPDRKDYGPVQLANYLGLTEWQFERALADGLIAPADVKQRSRWSASLAWWAAARINEILAAVGTIPDLGAVRSAEVLSERLGIDMTPDGVEELARCELLPVAGYYKGHAVYDGRALEAFTDVAAAACATRVGELRTADDSAAYLRIRRSDFDHLIRARLLRPVRRGYGPFDRKGRPTVPLYRTGDLDHLATRPGIDWDAVRQAKKGQRSPLAALPALIRSQA